MTVNSCQRVSVIIATYNRADFLVHALESVLNQTYRDFEIIVVDDGSTDNTKEALQPYIPHLQYIYQENKGRSESRNTGVKVAKGEYLAFLDDDDIWLPSKLERQITFLDANPDIALVHTFTSVIDEQGSSLPERTKERLQLYKKALEIGYTYKGMSRLCVMFFSSVMVRSTCFAKVGLLDPAIEAFEDWDFYLRLALEYRIGTIREPLVKYRVHGVQSTTDQFVRGRIQTSLKHLNLVNSELRLPSVKKARFNFYTQLAHAYYIAMDLRNSQRYILKALSLTPTAILHSRLGIHLLMTILPPNFNRRIRQLKGVQN